MAWYDEAVFYHIYPLGLLDAPKENDYSKPEVHRLRKLKPWIDHIKEIGCNALYIGPLFESVGHGYETTDYKRLDRRLGDNEDLKQFVKDCHAAGIKVIFDAVFNHTGRDFFAFQDIKKNRENSRYKDWYCNVNFGGNNSYNDGFSYDNWGGYDLLVRLNQRNPEVQGYIADVIRFWVKEFDVDGLRLDTADVLDFDFMAMLRRVANEVKPDFYLMGEVIHGEYNRWVNPEHLHAVTNYALNKALWSGHNEHNYFEIAHTERRLLGMNGVAYHLYNFSDNHDVARIMSKLNNKAHFVPVQILVYTLPGVPSVYYGSEFGFEADKQRGSDANLRPAIDLDDYKDAVRTNPCTETVAKLGKMRQKVKALSYGEYHELVLTNRQFAYSRVLDDVTCVIAVNNDDHDVWEDLPAGPSPEYVGTLSGEHVRVENGRIHVLVKANSGDVWVPAEKQETANKENNHAVAEASEKADPESETTESESADRAAGALKETSVKKEEKPAKEDLAEQIKEKFEEKKGGSSANGKEEEKKSQIPAHAPADKAYEDMTVPELQAAVLDKMAQNGPVTDYMRKTVEDNVYHDSLVNWVKSFR